MAIWGQLKCVCKVIFPNNVFGTRLLKRQDPKIKKLFFQQQQK